MGFFIDLNICMEQQELFERDTTAWVYESPDGGKTIYRRKLMDPSHKRELIKQIEDEFRDYREWIYKQHWNDLVKHPAVKDAIDKLKTVVALVQE